MKKQFPKTEDLQAERATDERIPFSVIRTFVDSLGKDPTPELEHILQNSFSYAPGEDEISVRTLRSDRIKFIGLLEYRSVTLGVPERLAGILADQYIRLLYRQDPEQWGSATLEAYRAFDAECQKCRIKRPRGNKIFNCMEYLENHVTEKVDLQSMADTFGYNPSYLCQKFKAVTGMTIHTYATECKLREAAVLLTQTDRNLSDIASNLGFSNQSHFHRVFKNRYGTTPTKWRKEHRREK